MCILVTSGGNMAAPGPILMASSYILCQLEFWVHVDGLEGCLYLLQNMLALHPIEQRIHLDIRTDLSFLIRFIIDTILNMLVWRTGTLDPDCMALSRGACKLF